MYKCFNGNKNNFIVIVIVIHTYMCVCVYVRVLDIWDLHRFQHPRSHHGGPRRHGSVVSMSGSHPAGSYQRTS